MSITSLFGPAMPEEHEETQFDAAPLETRECTKCHVEKPVTEFHKDKTHGSGRRSQCRSCRSERRTSRSVRRELDEKSQINRDALLRLVQAHRSEFESYVNAETVRRRGADAAAPLSRAAWIHLA